MKMIMFKNLNSDGETEIEHTRSGRTFIEFPLVNLFEKSHKPTQEEELLNEEHSGSAREEEENTEELCREES
jgi:hypothetical protein